MLIGTVNTSYATNFSGGIAGDELIDDNIQKDINDEFISQKIQGKLNAGREVITVDENGAGIGNIIVGPNANLKGAIIVNQSNNKGAAAIAR